MLFLILPTLSLSKGVNFTAEEMESPGSHASGCSETGAISDQSQILAIRHSIDIDTCTFYKLSTMPSFPWLPFGLFSTPILKSFLSSVPWLT